MIYPIAETFHSVQGEARWAGTPMFFIRLAGCNVGEYLRGSFLPNIQVVEKELPLLTNHEHSVCTTVTGQKFLCDTDYRTAERLTEADILSRWQTVKEPHVCITGGEPFLHNLTPLVLVLQKQGVMIHIETSGTKPIAFPPDADLDFPEVGEVDWKQIWVTCSPKKGFLPELLPRINEVKLLIGGDFDKAWVQRGLQKFLETMQVTSEFIYLQPINGVMEAIDSSLKLCLDLLQEYPQLKLSAQLHKYISQR